MRHGTRCSVIARRGFGDSMIATRTKYGYDLGMTRALLTNGRTYTYTFIKWT